jgi:hypothetical protein
VSDSTAENPLSFSVTPVVPIESLCIVPAKPKGDLEFAAAFAVEEIERVSGIRPPLVAPSETSDFGFAIILDRFAGRKNDVDDSYSLSSGDAFVTISAASKRGLLFGIGRFLRLSPVHAGSLEIPSGIDLEYSPSSRIRGHQIGYGHLSNCMDSWSGAQFERHIRDLILFGCNWIEIEYKPDPSPHHRMSCDEMNAAISGIAARYDLDCTVWIPNWGGESHYLDPDSSRNELAERRRFFSSLPRVSAITVPGGDPGRLRPHILFPWVERLTEQLGSCGHPPAAWVSAQWMSTDSAWYDSFVKFANRKPDWLSGIVHGPWTQLSIPELRRRLREDLPIRRYDDLTHGIYCQYPIPDWDLAHALTSGREPINPRPRAYKHIHNYYCTDAIGSTPHTTGINADINTFVWLDQEWDPTTEVGDTLRQYARVFLDRSVEDNFPDAILALERNWEGPLVANDGVAETLGSWRQLETSAGPDLVQDWRFQGPLLRATYDAYIQKRLLRETEIERQAVKRLSTDRSVEAIVQSLNGLKEASIDPTLIDLRQRCIALSEKLNQSIGLKSSVDRHRAAQRGRGAFMDAIDEPLNDSRRLICLLEEAVRAVSDVERKSVVDGILTRAAAGSDGIYDNLGNPGQIGMFENAVDFHTDPGGLAGSRWGFGIAIDGMSRSQTVEVKLHNEQPIPLAWLTCAEAIYNTPLTLLYDGLDDTTAYELQIVYPSRIGRRAKLLANDTHLVHECITTGDEPTKSFSIPVGVVKNGRLKLTWTGEGERGIQVAELWLTPD